VYETHKGLERLVVVLTLSNQHFATSRVSALSGPMKMDRMLSVLFSCIASRYILHAPKSTTLQINYFLVAKECVNKKWDAIIKNSMSALEVLSFFLLSAIKFYELIKL
jgi:hypothetical protein